jgi:hypothetical protein
VDFECSAYQSVLCWEYSEFTPLQSTFLLSVPCLGEITEILYLSAYINATEYGPVEAFPSGWALVGKPYWGY